MPAKQVKKRKEYGAAMLGLVISIFFFILFCGLFAFDATRVQMAERELTAACDSAAIAGTAMLASFDSSPSGGTDSIPLSTAQIDACYYAYNMFSKGTMLGQPIAEKLNWVTTLQALKSPIAPYGCNVMTIISDPTNNYAPVQAGDPNGKAVTMYACYGYVPVFLSALPFSIGETPILSFSTGGLPQVDSVVVFDYSGSMDDFTFVSFVRREWDWMNSSGKPDMNQYGYMKYTVLSTPGPSHTLSDYVEWNYNPVGGNPEGSAVNVLPPQNLESTANGGTSWMGNPLNYSPNLRANYLFYFVCQGHPQQTIGVANPNAPPACGNPANQITPSHWDFGSPPGNFRPVFQDVANFLGNGNTYLFTAADMLKMYGLPVNLYNSFLPGFATGQGPQNPNGTYYMCSNGDSVTFTDLVVNIVDPVAASNYVQPIPQSSHFVGFTWDPSTDPTPDPRLIAYGPVSFPDISVVVEAARGNLDNGNNMIDSYLHGAAGAGINGNAKVEITDDYGVQHPPAAFAITNVPNPTNCYQLAYRRLAMIESQPYATAIDGCQNGFFFKVNELCDSRFGFVGFSNTDTGDGVSGFQGLSNEYSRGTSQNISYHVSSTMYYFSPGDSRDQWIWGSGFWYGGGSDSPGSTPIGQTWACNTEALEGNGAQGQGFRIPRIPIDKANNNLNLVCSEPQVSNPACYNNPQPIPGCIWSSSAGTPDADGVWNGRPIAGTYTDEALFTAIQMFMGPNYNFQGTGASDRPAARRAIIFFTDGEPTGGIGGFIGRQTLLEAYRCKTMGVAIYTIGLNMSNNSQIQSDQYSFLGDGVVGGQGLAYVAGNGGKFFPCSTGSDVRLAFTNVARRLSQSQR